MNTITPWFRHHWHQVFIAAIILALLAHVARDLHYGRHSWNRLPTHGTFTGHVTSDKTLAEQEAEHPGRKLVIPITKEVLGKMYQTAVRESAAKDAIIAQQADHIRALEAQLTLNGVTFDRFAARH